MTQVNPEYRLRNLLRRLRDLVMSRRLSADPEKTGVVELADFGKRCDRLAAFCAESLVELGDVRGEKAICARRIVEDAELAARLAAEMETLPRTPERVGRQCSLLEEVTRRTDAALAVECRLEEPPVVMSLSTIARGERDRFSPFVDFDGRIAESPPGEVDRAHLLRTLRRALLDHEGGPFSLSVSKEGVLRFGEFEFTAEAVSEGLARSPHEPPEVKKALDMREGAPDPALADFLLVKAVDEALFALLSPRLPEPALVEKARALPRKPGKRLVVRPEAVRRPVEGWDAAEAARGAEKVAARRLGPAWARLPRGAYVLRLFFSENDELAADLLALGTALRRMEKGEEVAGTAPRAERALRGLLGLLG